VADSSDLPPRDLTLFRVNSACEPIEVRPGGSSPHEDLPSTACVTLTVEHRVRSRRFDRLYYPTACG